jgi:hypothetical protein
LTVGLIVAVAAAAAEVDVDAQEAAEAEEVTNTRLAADAAIGGTLPGLGLFNCETARSTAEFFNFLQGSKFCVCSFVLITSKGFVNAAATAPDIQPANIVVVKLYFPLGFNIFLADSLAETITIP